MRKDAACLALAMLAMATGAGAGDQFSYNRIEIDLRNTAIDKQELRGYLGVGVGVSGSMEITPHLFGLVAVHRIGYDQPNIQAPVFEDDIRFRQDEYQAGLGWNLPLATKLDLVTSLSWLHLHRRYRYEEIPGTDYLDASGPRLDLGLRGFTGRHFAWTLGAHLLRMHVDVDATTGALDFRARGNKLTGRGVNAGFRVQFTRLFGVGVDFSANHHDADENEGRVEVKFRLQFGDRDGPPN